MIISICSFALLAVVSIQTEAIKMGQPKVMSDLIARGDDSAQVPLPTDNFTVHDPAAVFSNGHYYLFAGSTKGVGIPYYRSQKDSLTGPWNSLGQVLPGGSKISEQGEDSQKPWAPAVVIQDNTMYVFYAVTIPSSMKSAIGVATTTTPDDATSWTDHGAIMYTGQGPNTNLWPFNITNAIDPSILIDTANNSQPILQYGSYYGGIIQLPLSPTLLSLVNPHPPFSALRVAYSPAPATPRTLGAHPIEGSFLSYHSPYYYLWYAHGLCCGFSPSTVSSLPLSSIYEIRIGRSTVRSGPFLDQQGRDLNDGGGTTILSSHGNVFAPGGPGVLKAPNGGDILYYHFLPRDGNLTNESAELGWNPLGYGDDGWPVLSSEFEEGRDPSTRSGVPSRAGSSGIDWGPVMVMALAPFVIMFY
ncbi:MAG: hypothetical protein M1820_008926 [Bogoriella megaspora]|nr:MAG: hypothetical protein M1820_008926 [Bogoriella megaspora]